MSTPTGAEAPTAAPSQAQIHDLGYRTYDGPRLGEGAAAWALFVLGLRHAFGLGRSLKARILPLGVLVCSLLPAIVMVSVVAMFPIEQLPLQYHEYPTTLQVLTSIFAAAQAPVIFSRDLRYRTLTLYLSRPLRRGTYVAARTASLFVAVLVVVALPVVVLWLGAMLAGLDAGAQARAFAKTLPVLLVLAAVLTIVTAVVSSLTPRHGLAVVASIATLVTSFGIAESLSAVISSGTSALGMHASWPGVLNPFTLSRGLGSWWWGQPTTTAPPEGVDGWVYLGFAALTVVGGWVFVAHRYRTAGDA